MMYVCRTSGKGRLPTPSAPRVLYHLALHKPPGGATVRLHLLAAGTQHACMHAYIPLQAHRKGTYCLQGPGLAALRTAKPAICHAHKSGTDSCTPLALLSLRRSSLALTAPPAPGACAQP